MDASGGRFIGPATVVVRLVRAHRMAARAGARADVSGRSLEVVEKVSGANFSVDLPSSLPSFLLACLWHVEHAWPAAGRAAQAQARAVAPGAGS